MGAGSGGRLGLLAWELPGHGSPSPGEAQSRGPPTFLAWELLSPGHGGPASERPSPEASQPALPVSRPAAEPLSPDEVIALSNQTLRERDQDLREKVAHSIRRAFTWANITTLILLVGLVCLDQWNIRSDAIKPGDRIITNQVFMALLGATTVQVGTIAVIIARYLFPGRQT